MEIHGKVIAALETRTGTNARGEWAAQDFVLETHDQYSRKMLFSVWGADRLKRFNIQVGQEVLVQFDIEAREYNGRWFNSVRAFNVTPYDPASIMTPQPFTQPQPQPQQAAPQAPTFPNEPSQDDLPF